MRLESLQARLVHWTSRERGAWFFLPGLVAAAVIVLWGIHLVPRGQSLYTRVTATRVAIGPWRCAPADEAAQQDFLSALGRGLRAHGDLELVDAERVLRQLGGLVHAGVQAVPRDVHRALRSLNAHVVVTGRFEMRPRGCRAAIEAFDARAESPPLCIESVAGSPVALGRAVADSLHAALQRPHALRAAGAPSTRP